MVKIAHVTTIYLPGATARDTGALALDQRKRGWEVEIFTGRQASLELIQERRSQGTPITQIPCLRKYVHPLDDFKTILKLSRIFKAKNFDVVHTHLAKAGIIGRLAAVMAGIKKIIHTTHGASFAPTLPPITYYTYLNLEKLAGKFTDRFLFVGQDIRNAYVKAGVCPREKTFVSYVPKDLSPFLPVATLPEVERQERRQKAGIDPETIVLGNISRLVPWKGHEYGLRLLSELKKDFGKIKYIIVGAPRVPVEMPHWDYLINLAKSLGVFHDVVFAGWQTDTPYFYSLFDIYLITSMPFEGLSLSLLEATAADLPIVGFDCYGTREVLGENANIVPPKDLGALVQAVKREIARLPESRRQRGKNITRIMKLQERHSLPRRLKEHAELYQALLGNHNVSLLNR